MCTLVRPYVLPHLWKAFGKLPRSAFAPTSTQTPSRPVCGTLIIFSAPWDPELNRQSLGFSRNLLQLVLCTLARPYILPSLWKAFRKLPRSAFAPASTQTPSRLFSGTLIIFSACWYPELEHQSLGFLESWKSTGTSFVHACSTLCSPLSLESLWRATTK